MGFTANAGDILSFEWNFLTDEVTDASLPKNDTAFLTLVNNTSLSANVITLGSVSDSVFSTGGLGFARATGTTVFSQTLSAGDYSLGFVVVDDVDRIVSSGLVIDNVQVRVVPEPSSVLSVLVLGAIALLTKPKIKTNSQDDH
ncbi:hypothetical protein [Gloeocapsa sp. PCC 73106]|uniref:hypothetical protein n=1 Tax=Gloeocapsa sp. PCC 73106 TaxID=102232 RepID=UPI0002ACCD54|nr:hypothetical protein [Gloeocapsa sp. PCC 73106]ELR98449.1 hypothetical protein GLO73106DRAFT_00022820 [Gloeocapsa sp. PCC 73106]